MKNSPKGMTANDVVSEYDHTVSRIGNLDMPVDAAPELAAALVHFAEHRNTSEGLYAFIDIGGGTVDGSVFRLSRDAEGPRFDILSANVDEVGTMAVARRLVAEAYLKMSEIVEKPLIFGGQFPAPTLSASSELEERIQTFFATTIGDARKNLPGQFFAELSYGAVQTRPGLNAPRKPVIPVLVAGGGCRSDWYRNLFSRTYKEYNHEALGIGGYRIETVPTPAGIVDEQYPRFVVAIGLTSQSLHFDKYRLPSRYGPANQLPERQPNVPPYSGR